VSDIRIAIAGATGRMGRTLVQEVHKTPGLVIAGGLERAGHSELSKDLGAVAGIDRINVPLTDDPLELIARVEALIDFTAPESSVALAALAAQARIVHVIGTTGFSEDDEAKIKAAARHATIIKSGNMSLGVNLLAGLVAQAAKALGDEFDIDISETHHRHKVDAPSGTALMLGRAAAEARGHSLESIRDKPRDGVTGARERGHIGFASLRVGSVVGDHTVTFASEGERIELSHRAESRVIFARGAIKAAQWGQGRPRGLYSMQHVLGFAPA
jgi:4-hydroxy-tetrahydrodipicolinate reductase